MHRRYLFISTFVVQLGLLDSLSGQVLEPALTPIETIEVVGSHIQGLDASRIGPVLSLDRAEIERSGTLTVGEFLEQLPMNNGGTFNDRNALSAAPGGSSISFRGLGPSASLILVNGRPLAAYAFQQSPEFGALVDFVDTNNVPLAAVERIEVFKDGASAIYGSQAMAGVINIVLRDSFTGTSLDLRRGLASADGAEETAFSLLSGLSLNKTDLRLILTRTDRSKLAWQDRSVSRSANGEPSGGVDLRSLAAANFTFGSVGSFGADCQQRAETGFELVDIETSNFGICLFDPNSQIVVPSVTKTGLTLLAGRELTPNLSLEIEANLLMSDAEGRRDPVAFLQGTFPAGNPWNPFGRDVLTDYRFSETGQRIDQISTDNRRLVVALDGLAGEWAWQLSALRHESTNRTLGEGYLNIDRIEAALNGVDLNADGVLDANEYLNLYSPASNPNSFALTNSLKASTARHSVSMLKNYLAKALRRFGQLPGGQLIAAVGVEHRTESLDDWSDPLSLGSLLAAADFSQKLWHGRRVDLPLDQIDPFAYIDPRDEPISALETTGFPSAFGSQSTDAAFAEIRMPALPELDIQLALRYDEIQDFNDNFSPRVALSFGQGRRIRSRASWSRGFRAPSPGELFRGQSTKLQGSWDPKRCPQFVDPWIIPERAGGCITTVFVVSVLGNSELAPEESESTSAGIEGDISENHTAGMNCWRVAVRDKIVTPQTAWMIRNEDRLPPGTIERFEPDNFSLDPADYPGGIRRINILPLNFGRQEVRGCDLDVDSVFGDVANGILRGQLLATHMASNRLAFGPDDPMEQLAGTYGYPKNRVNMNLFWSRNRWQAGLYARWTDGFRDAFGETEVGSHIEWDTQVRFAASAATTLTVGVENLFDDSPPSSLYSLQGFPVDYYDMRGRFFYLSLSHTLARNRRGEVGIAD